VAEKGGIGMVVQFKRAAKQSQGFDRVLLKLDGLVIDMKELRDGTLPEKLAGPDAPILDQWTPMLGNNIFLVGMATGHPKLVGTDRLISTSELFLVSEDKAWARTLSRWYRLGLEVGSTDLDG
jgi:hypothetical protein